MIAYIIKTIVCSAILLGFYHLVLEKERIHSFKRYYLLFSILFSLLVASITVTKVVPAPLPPPAATSEALSMHLLSDHLPVSPRQDTTSLTGYLLIIYISVTLFLLGRFIRNLCCIYARTSGVRTVNYKGAKLVLSANGTIPHSFLNYIFVSEKDYTDGTIEAEILSHELAHVRGRHSLDILLVELITLFAWINPLIFLYKRAIQLNHEFMADDWVARTADNIHSYQMLLLNKLSMPVKISFTSMFNFTNIKKRIVMMNYRHSNRFAILRQVAAIPLFAALVLLLSSKTVIYEPIAQVPDRQAIQPADTGNLIRQYYGILDNYKRTLTNGHQAYRLPVSEDDFARLKALFFRMSEEQQDSLFIVFIPRNTIILPQKQITREQFESFSDPRVYGVWIDGARIANEELTRYKHSDFSFFNVSPLMPNAFNYGKHEFQVNLMTNHAYQEHVQQTKEATGYRLSPRLTPPTKR